MAHVQMHQAPESGIFRAALEQIGKRRNIERELSQRERESRRSAGTALQNTRSKLDTDLEIAKLNNRNAELIAKFRAGMDAQMKQAGLDMDLQIQKLRNMNAMELAQYNQIVLTMLENLRDEHAQAQLIKKYETELRLANYNAKTALYRTFLDVVGDIYKTGDPISNAADAAAFGLFAAAFKMLYGKEVIDIPEGLDKGNLRDKVTTTEASSKEEISDEEIQELIRVLKGEKGSEHVAPGSKITKFKEPGWKTKIKLLEKQRAGTKPWEKR